MDTNLIAALVAANRWRLAIASIAIYLFIRVLKGDVEWFPTLPVWANRWKPVMSMALGCAAIVADHIANGVSWRDAVVLGLLAGILPIASHEVVINALRGGREIPMPKAGGGAGVLLLALALSMATSSCAGSFEEARLVGLKSASGMAKATTTERTADHVAFCRDIDAARRNWSASAKAFSVAAGAEGFAMLPLDRRWEPYLVGAIAITGIAGAYCFVQADSLGTLWARDCS